MAEPSTTLPEPTPAPQPLGGNAEDLWLQGAAQSFPVRPGVEAAPDPIKAWDVTKAAFRRENTVGAFLNHYENKDAPETTGQWSPWAYYKRNEDNLKDLSIELMSGEFDGVFSERDFLRRAEWLRAQKQDIKTLQQGGTVATLASIAAGVIDPINLLPMAPLRSTSRLVNAGIGALGFAATQGITEGVLQSQTYGRTAEESVFAVMGAGALGGAVGALHKFTGLKSVVDQNIPKTIEIADASGRSVPLGSMDAGAAAVSEDMLLKARTDSRITNKVLDTYDRIFEHDNMLTGTPASRLWHTPSMVARGYMVRILDLGGRLTEHMQAGKATRSAEAIWHAENQRLTGLHSELDDAFRQANLDMGSTPGRVALSNLAYRASMGSQDLSRIQRNDFFEMLTAIQMAKKFGDHPDAAMFSNIAMKRLREKGLTDEAIGIIAKHADAAGKKVDEFHARSLDRQLEAGAITPERHAELKAQPYGLSTLYESSQVSANSAHMRAMLMEKFAGDPPDSFLAELAESTVKVERAEGMDDAAFAQAKKSAIEAEVKRIRETPRDFDVAREDWRGSQEWAERAAAEERRAQLESQYQFSKKVLEQILESGKDYKASAGKATMKALKAEVHVQEARYFERLLGRRKAQIEKIDGNVATIEKELGDLEAEYARTLKDHSETMARAESAKASLDIDETLKDAVTNTGAEAMRLGGELSMAQKTGETEERIASLRKRLDEAKAASATARAEFKKAADEVTFYTKWRRNVNDVLNKLADDATAGIEKIKALKEEPGIDAALAAERERINHLAKNLDDAMAARKAAREDLKLTRKAASAVGKETDKLGRQARKAAKLDESLKTATPLGRYVQDLVDRLGGGGDLPTSTRVLDNVAENARMKEVKIKWTPKEYAELASRGLIDVDMHTNLTKYHTQVSGRVALQESIGTYDIATVKQAIREDYAELMKTAQYNGDSKTVSRLLASQKRAEEDAGAVMEKILGRARPGGQGDETAVWFADTFKGLAFIKQGGSMILSAVADIGQAMLLSTKAFPYMVEHFKTYGKILNEARGGKEGARELRILLSSMEGSMHMPGQTAFSGEFGGGMISNGQLRDKITHYTRLGGDLTAKLSGLSLFSDFMRRTISVGEMNVMLDTGKKLLNGGVLDQKTIANYASLGLGESELKRIAQQFEKHGEEWNGITLPNQQRWDPEARKVLDEALVLAQRRASFVPGIGMVPNMTVKWWGGLLLQFQSYAQGMTHSMLLTGMQRVAVNKDIGAAAGMATSILISGLMAAVRAKMRGEDSTQWTPQRWAAELVQRAGLLGFMGPYADAGLKFFDPANQWGLTSSKYRNNNWAESLAGPTAGNIGQIIGITQKIRDGETDKALEAAGRFMPLNQWWQFTQGWGDSLK